MLEVSTRGRYATRILIRLAMKSGGEPVPKHSLADDEQLSSDYVEQIMMKLKPAGLVRSHRGARGGFSLGRPPEEITVRAVLEATEGPLALTPCMTQPCPRQAACSTHELWQSATDALAAIFDRTTIAELAEKALAAEAVAPMSYAI